MANAPARAAPSANGRNGDDAPSPNGRSVQVAGGDIDGNGRADIITGARASGSPHVKAFSGSHPSPKSLAAGRVNATFSSTRHIGAGFW